MMQTNEIVPVVHVKDGQVFANSRDVAEFFGKRHADVLRAIDTILDRTPDRHRRNFAQVVYETERPDGSVLRTRSYDMTKDGFTFLVMGFTGAKARAFQDWVTKVVLPAIRKDGAYVAGEEKVAAGEMSER